MKTLTKDNLSKTIAGGCDFFTGFACGVSAGAILSGAGIGIGLLGAIGACGSLITDCRKK